MKQVVLVMVLCSFALLSNCSTRRTNKVNNGQNPGQTSTPEVEENLYTPRDGKPEQVLIYCDLTTSIKPEGIGSISKKLRKVLRNLPRGSCANIRLVEKNLLGDSPFTELQTPLPCKRPDTKIKRELVQARKKCEEKDAPYLTKVDEISKRITTLKPQENISCIMNTLEAAHDFFKGKDKERYNLRLIYFSDMIEQCNSNSIYICGKNNQPKKPDILAKIENGFIPTYKLQEVIGSNISIIITNSDNPDYKCLPLSEQKDIWRAIFAKTGYVNLDITTFNFTQEIPEELKFQPSG